MSYTGNDPVTQNFVAGTEYFNGDGIKTLYTVTRTISSIDDLLIFVDSVEVPPIAYSISANRVTFQTPPGIGVNNVVIRYLTTVLWQIAGTPLSYLYRQADVSSSFVPTLIASSVVQSIGSTTQLTVSSTGGLVVGGLISALTDNFTATVIRAINNNVYTLNGLATVDAIAANARVFTATIATVLPNGTRISFANNGAIYTITAASVGSNATLYTLSTPVSGAIASGVALYTITTSTSAVLTVDSTSAWGSPGTVRLTSIYSWTTPANNAPLRYNTTTQRWQPSIAQLTASGTSVGLGVNALTNVSGAGNTALGTNSLANATTSTNTIALGNNSASNIITSNNNVILGGYTGQGSNVDLRYTGNYGTIATLVFTIGVGSTAALASILTITFGAAATTYLPASVVTASIAANSNETVVASALLVALASNALIAANWYVVRVGAVVTLYAKTIGVYGFNTIAYSYNYSSPPSTGLVPVLGGNEGFATSADNNIVLSDGVGNIRAIANNNGWWGFNTTAPLAAVDINGSTRLTQAFEVAVLNTNSLTGTFNINITQGLVVFFNQAATGNFIFNLIGSGASPTATVNQILPIGHSLTIAFITTQGASAYYCTGLQVDGTTTGVTIKWQGPIAPSYGSANGFDVYLFTVLKTANATYTALGSRTQFGG